MSGRLTGRVCLVTGATSGHGRAVARGLARLGAQVVVHGRDRRRCEAVLDELRSQNGAVPEPAMLIADLASLDEVRRATREYLDSGRRLDLLVNNAGLVNRRREVSADGLELTFAVNYLSHFALTLGLMPRLVQTGQQTARARIVNVSSDMHRIVKLDLDDLQLQRRYSWMRAYGRSKLALVHFTLELARRLAVAGVPVNVNAMDPGPVESRIGMNHEGLIPHLLAVVMRLFFPSAERAAGAAVELCTETGEDVTGAYFKFRRQRTLRLGHDAHETASRLWRASESLTGCDLELS